MSIETPFFRVRWTLCGRSAWTLPLTRTPSSTRSCAMPPAGTTATRPRTCRRACSWMPRSSAAIVTSAAISSPSAPRSSSPTLRRRNGACTRSPTGSPGSGTPPAKARRAGRQFRPRQRARPRRPAVPGPRRAVCRTRPGRRRPGARTAVRPGRPAADDSIPQPAPARTARLRWRAGHRHADADSLHAGQLLRTVQKRLAAIGLRRRDQGGDREAPFDDRPSRCSRIA